MGSYVGTSVLKDILPSSCKPRLFWPMVDAGGFVATLTAERLIIPVVKHSMLWPHLPAKPSRLAVRFSTPKHSTINSIRTKSSSSFYTSAPTNAYSMPSQPHHKFSSVNRPFTLRRVALCTLNMVYLRQVRRPCLFYSLSSRMRARGMPKLELNGLATGHWSGEGLGVLWNQFSVVMKNPTRPFVVLVAIDPGSSSSESEDWPSASDDDDEEGAPAANALHPRLHFHPMQGSHFVD